jgi:probable HAF family extracellular repeat protein
MQALLPKFSGTTVALGINNQRQVVGYAQDKTSYSAFITDAAAFRAVYIQAPRAARGTQYSVAYGVNDAGMATGEANARAFLYLQGKQYDLNALVSNGAGWVLTTAYHLNAAGQIVGVGNLNGHGHGFLMTPVR